MRRTILMLVSIVCLMVLGAVLRFEFRDRQGRAGGRFHRSQSNCTVASVKAPGSDRSAANTSEHGN